MLILNVMHIDVVIDNVGGCLLSESR